MDISTPAGLGLGLVLILVAMGSSVPAFIDIPSMLIVVGGTIAATMVSYPLDQVLGISKIVMKTMFFSLQPDTEIIKTLIDFATKARRDGILALEEASQSISDVFFKKGLQLAIDGNPPEVIEAVLSTEIEKMEARHQGAAGILSAMGNYAPAFGMIGTLVGLVQMLKNLQDPSSIGASMAVALITTFYGAVLANLFFLPLAAKLRYRSQQESMQMNIIMTGILSIQSGDNPRVVEEKLKTFLPPASRADVSTE